VHLDDLVGTARFAGILTAAPGTCDVRALGHRMLAQVAMARGQLRSARHQLALAAPCDPGAALELGIVLATHPLVPPDSELAALRVALDSTPGIGTDSLVRRYYVALAGLDLGDTTAAKRAVRTLGAAREHGSNVALAGTLAHSLTARLALGRGRPADALAELEAAGWERTARLTIAEAADRFLRAELLRKLGREQEATGWYASIAERASYELIYLAPAEWRLGEMAEAAGDRATAAPHYRRFAELWKDADPELRSTVENIRGRF
jgi:tetratricopeptide (TPR) repeat protein